MILKKLEDIGSVNTKEPDIDKFVKGLEKNESGITFKGVIKVSDRPIEFIPETLLSESGNPIKLSELNNLILLSAVAAPISSGYMPLSLV